MDELGLLCRKKESRFVVARRGRRGWAKWVKVIQRSKLPVIK